MKNLSEEVIKKVDEQIKKFPKKNKKSAILNVLHILQEENDGWLSEETMNYAAETLKISPIEVYEVATFYSMFNLKPVGKHVFEVCQTGPCMLRGSDKIIGYIKQKLDIEVGDTTKDGLFTLKTVECLGACGYAPMMQKGKHYEEFLTQQRIDQIIDETKKKYANT